MKRKTALAVGSVIATMAAAGAATSCSVILGLDAYYDCPEDPRCAADGGSGGSGGTTVTTSTGGAAPEVCTVNGVRDGKETDVDCGGGICDPCDDGKGCSTTADCVSHVCTAGVCYKPGCGDGVKNGDETDTDCGGGSCGPCGPGLGCAVDGDCVSGQCMGGACVSTCDDLLKGGSESDVDCGGSCAPCGDDKGCKAGADCQSGVCQAAVCKKN